MSIDIDGVLQSARDQLEASSSPLASPTANEEVSTTWQTFESHLSSLKAQKQKSRTHQYYVDDEIVAALSQCDFNRHTLTNVVNAILITFIQEQKTALRQRLKPTSKLLQ